jgi:hypothetical protein
VQFFIPHLAEGSTSEDAWNEYLKLASLPPTTRPLRSIMYEHGGDRYVVTVGSRRKKYARLTGPKGGYIKNAGQSSVAVETGTDVTAICDPAQGTTKPIHVFSMPPYGGWGHPSYVGWESVTDFEAFD